MAARVGTCAGASLVAAQLLRVRETWPQDVWARTGRIQLASAFICSLITGKWQAMTESEACATGMWIHGAAAAAANSNPPGGTGLGLGLGHWDETVLDIVGGSREEGRRVRGWLGEVDISGGSKRIGHVSRFLVDRYGFDPGNVIPISTITRALFI
jgi:xylulokinase